MKVLGENIKTFSKLTCEKLKSFSKLIWKKVKTFSKLIWKKLKKFSKFTWKKLKIFLKFIWKMIKTISKFIWKTMKTCAHSTWNESKNTCKEPRQVFHSFKVGVGAAVVALLYLIKPTIQQFGKSVLFTIMVLVAVFESNTGETILKVLNHLVGTGGALLFAFLVQYVADTFGNVYRVIFISAAVCFIGAVSSFVRFFPYVKKNCDYAVSVWLLTFCVVHVTSAQVENVLKISRERFVASLMGCAMSLVLAFIFPIWSGDLLRSSTVSRIEKLSKLVQACVCELFRDDEEESKEPSPNEYLGFVESESNDETETWALHSSWEPRYLSHFRSSWKEYVTFGSSIRHLGTTLVTLHGISKSKIQEGPKSIRNLFKDPCTRLATEISKALEELATCIRKRQHWSEDQILSPGLRKAQQDVKTVLDSLLVENPKAAALVVAGFLCVLEQLVERLEEVVDQGKKLATVAQFKEDSEMGCCDGLSLAVVPFWWKFP